MKPYLHILLLLAVLFLVGVMVYLARDYLSMAVLGRYEAELRQQATEHPCRTFGIGFLVYYLAAFLSVPGINVLSVAAGWALGFTPGILLSSFAAVAGATTLMLLTRHCLKQLIEQRFSSVLKKFDTRFGGDCPYCLFTLRLFPGVPFALANILPALTPMKTSTFWWVSQVGMLPGTIVFVYAGSSLPSLVKLQETGVSGLVSPNLIVAFAVIGLLPIAMKQGMEWFRRRKTIPTP